jgi:hypothetical protein
VRRRRPTGSPPTLFLLTIRLLAFAVNFVTGVTADQYGRKKTEMLGWAFGLAVPLLILFAESFSVYTLRCARSRVLDRLFLSF